MLYGLECWAINKKLERRMNIADMKMLRWICEVIREDRIKHLYIRGSITV